MLDLLSLGLDQAIDRCRISLWFFISTSSSRASLIKKFLKNTFPLTSDLEESVAKIIRTFYIQFFHLKTTMLRRELTMASICCVIYPVTILRWTTPCAMNREKAPLAIGHAMSKLRDILEQKYTQKVKYYKIVCK